MGFKLIEGHTVLSWCRERIRFNGLFFIGNKREAKLRTSDFRFFRRFISFYVIGFSEVFRLLFFGDFVQKPFKPVQ